ncbi:hypothetical protein SUGI_1491420 [Cryptomeria japonica]|uniref:Uncharacterized protein n=1 Tax=Cryptomeria japonica TaxID=3369 RepID=A0AAD3NS71_CRYJA|nr:hypothetical protein SUGI_1373380 [Cryptomeria japonica]GLJ59076.1 hypothetical protein SUGI_1491420 [Cryptomeria japonica]
MRRSLHRPARIEPRATDFCKFIRRKCEPGIPRGVQGQHVGLKLVSPVVPNQLGPQPQGRPFGPVTGASVRALSGFSVQRSLVRS